MRPVKDPDFLEQHDGHPTALPLTDFCPKLHKQSFDVPPGQAAVDRTGKDQLQGALVLSPQRWHGTAKWYRLSRRSAAWLRAALLGLALLGPAVLGLIDVGLSVASVVQ